MKCFSRRSEGREFLDDPATGEEELRASFKFIAFVNRYAGGCRAALTGMTAALHSWPRPEPLRVLDAGCGAGDMGPVIVRWGNTHGFDIRYTGIDRSERIIALAREQSRGYGLEFKTMDLFDPALPEADCIIASMVLHHLSDRDARRAISHLFSKAKAVFIINDLRRSAISYAACWLATLFADRVSRSDALLSIKNGFLENELRSLVSDLPRHYQLSRQPFGRLLLIIPS